MRAVLTRLARERLRDVCLPRTCHAWTSLRALTDPECECDCRVFCKFGPPGNAPELAVLTPAEASPAVAHAASPSQASARRLGR